MSTKATKAAAKKSVPAASKKPAAKKGRAKATAPAAEGPMVTLTVGQMSHGQKQITVPASYTKAQALREGGYGSRIGERGFGIFSDAQKVAKPERELVREGEVLAIAAQSKDG